MDYKLHTLFFSLLACLVTLSEGATVYYWQVTDLHYDPTYETTQQSCNENITNIRDFPLGHFECDAPWRLVAHAVRAMRLEHPTPEFILWTGDEPHHAKTKSHLTRQLTMDIIRNVSVLIRNEFPRTPVYPVMGNHDYWPVNQLPGRPNDIYDEMADMWRGWLPEGAVNGSVIETFKRGGYYSAKLPGRPGNQALRVLTLNTNLYYTRNWVTEGESDPGGQLAWLRAELESARRQREKVHLVTHMPPGMLEKGQGVNWLRPKQNALFNNILRDHADVIVTSYSAHQHSDSFRVFYKNRAPVLGMFVAPAVTPWKARIPGGRIGDPRNPAIRKFSYDSITGNLLDVEQFYLDLNDANAILRDNPDYHVDWKREYSWIRIYKNNVTPQGLHKLAEEFKPYGSELFHKYTEHNTVLARNPSSPGCNCTCKQNHICAIQHVDFQPYRQCVADHRVTCGADHVTPLTLVTLALISLWVVLTRQ